MGVIPSILILIFLSLSPETSCSDYVLCNPFGAGSHGAPLNLSGVGLGHETIFGEKVRLYNLIMKITIEEIHARPSGRIRSRSPES